MSCLKHESFSSGACDNSSSIVFSFKDRSSLISEQRNEIFSTILQVFSDLGELSLIAIRILKSSTKLFILQARKIINSMPFLVQDFWSKFCDPAYTTENGKLGLGISSYTKWIKRCLVHTLINCLLTCAALDVDGYSNRFHRYFLLRPRKSWERKHENRLKYNFL